ncbi:MAG: helix-hairpin-helix domain-containing protein [Methylobacterium frigidaeris]
MLTGSAVTRALVIVVLAAGLAMLWQMLAPRTGEPPVSEPPKVGDAGRGEAAKPADAAVRSVYPGPRPPEAAPPRPQPDTAPVAPPPVAQAPPPVFSPPAAPPEPSPAAAAQAEPAPPAAAGVLDLNTATLSELNGLRGGGMIGKAIVAGRPYGRPQDLLSRRILSRSTFERIKDQVTVR